MQGYQCSECGGWIGLMANQAGLPDLFKCPKTGNVAELQIPIHRDTPNRPLDVEVGV